MWVLLYKKLWAGRKNKAGVVNIYSYIEDSMLKILKFNKMNDEWLDFIGKCRGGYIHDYDVVEGSMAKELQEALEDKYGYFD